MVDQTTIFKADDKPPVAPEANSQAPVVDPNSPLAILVGEGRKYKTQEELAKAYIHIDEFAETLKGENTKLRQELEKAKTLDEVLERLQAAPQSAQDKGGKKEAGNAPVGLSVADVVKIVGEQLTGRETARTRESNLLKADAEMKRLFGEKSREMFEKEASSPALRNALIELASVSPDKFVALFSPAQAVRADVDNKTNVNTGALNSVAVSGRAADPGCKEFYDAIRRKDPALYYSQAMQIQIQQAGTANPAKYFGRT